MDFITKLPIFTNWKSETYDLILVIIDRLTKIIYYKPIKMIIDTLALVKVIIKIKVWYHGLSDLIVTDWGSVFISKFWLSLCYFLRIKQKLLTAFYPQINSQIEKQNSIIKVYLQVFVNFKPNDWARFLPMAKFAYNNIKNASTSHTSFKLNYGDHPQTSYKKDINSCFKAKSADKLATKLRELIIVYKENF